LYHSHQNTLVATVFSRPKDAFVPRCFAFALLVLSVAVCPASSADTEFFESRNSEGELALDFRQGLIDGGSGGVYSHLISTKHPLRITSPDVIKAVIRAISDATLACCWTIDSDPYPTSESGRRQFAEDILRDDNPLARRVFEYFATF